MKQFFLILLLSGVLSLLPFGQDSALAKSKAKSSAPGVTQIYTLSYKAFWGGIYAGDLNWFLRQQKSKYHTNFQIKTRGFFDAIYRMNIEGQSDGHIVKYTPQVLAFSMNNITRKRERQNGWSIDPKNKTKKNILNPADANRVPLDMLKDTIDPAAGILKLRERLRQARQNQKLDTLKDLKLKIYDGRRRFDVTVTAIREGREKIQEKDHRVISLDLLLDPIAGIRQDDIEAWRSTKTTLHFSDDGVFIPLKVVAITPTSPAIITLDGGCIGTPPCKAESKI